MITALCSRSLHLVRCRNDGTVVHPCKIRRQHWHDSAWDRSRHSKTHSCHGCTTLRVDAGRHCDYTDTDTDPWYSLRMHYVLVGRIRTKSREQASVQCNGYRFSWLVSFDEPACHLRLDMPCRSLLMPCQDGEWFA